VDGGKGKWSGGQDSRRVSRRSDGIMFRRGLLYAGLEERVDTGGEGKMNDPPLPPGATYSARGLNCPPKVHVTCLRSVSFPVRDKSRSSGRPTRDSPTTGWLEFSIQGFYKVRAFKGFFPSSPSFLYLRFCSYAY